MRSTESNSPDRAIPKARSRAVILEIIHWKRSFSRAVPDCRHPRRKAWELAGGWAGAAPTRREGAAGRGASVEESDLRVLAVEDEFPVAVFLDDISGGIDHKTIVPDARPSEDFPSAAMLRTPFFKGDLKNASARFC
jgi:hypothetical protein